MEIRVLSSVAIMRAIVDRIGCKLNAFNEDGVYRRESFTGGSNFFTRRSPTPG